MLTVITGPPCAGKTTYLRQHARPGDITVDFDAIAQALGSPSAHDHDQRLREIAAAAWSAAVDRAVTRYPGLQGWIIDSRPTRQRQAAYQRAGARFVDLRPDAAELHRRAEAGGRPASTHQEIDKWTAGTTTVQERTRW